MVVLVSLKMSDKKIDESLEVGVKNLPWIHMLLRFARKKVSFKDMGVSKNSGTPKSSILIGFSIINHPFLGYPYFWKHPYSDPNAGEKW